MKIPRVATVDFETDGILPRPHYPPRPVGVSIALPGSAAPTYYAWGHPTGNNISPVDGLRLCRKVFRDPSHELLFHNSKFDTEVYREFMDPGWVRDPLHVHDTMFLLAQHDPYAFDYKLKPSAHRILGMPPEEQDALREWILAHVPEAKRKPSEWGAYISRAPGGLVGKYAKGDVIRTLKLFQKLWKWLVEIGSVEAYQREQRLMPVLQRNEAEGLRCDVAQLEKDVKLYQADMLKADNWLRKRLKRPDMNIDSDRELAEALSASGVVTEWELTEKSKMPSVSKKSLTMDKFHDSRVGLVLGYRNRLATCLGTFMQPWLMMARESGGRIHTSWRQVRGATAGGGGGAATGRLQSSPNFQNIPKSFEGRGDGYTHPAFAGLTPLPRMRRYVLADAVNDVFVVRDYNQQELRILAHFEAGALMAAYLENPRLDVHEFVRQAIIRIFGIELQRDKTKTLNFGMLYGMGLGALALALATTVAHAKELKNAQLGALPGLKGLSNALRDAGRRGEAIYTWGGRPYLVEPAKMIKGRLRTFEYKLLNQLIQGSAADCTKEAIIRYDSLPNRASRLLVSVHDEIDINSPRKALARETQRLREVMQSVEFDVPMLSDCKFGPNWAELTKLEEA